MVEDGDGGHARRRHGGRKPQRCRTAGHQAVFGASGERDIRRAPEIRAAPHEPDVRIGEIRHDFRKLVRGGSMVGPGGHDPIRVGRHPLVRTEPYRRSRCDREGIQSHEAQDNTGGPCLHRLCVHCFFPFRWGLEESSIPSAAMRLRKPLSCAGVSFSWGARQGPQSMPTHFIIALA